MTSPLTCRVITADQDFVGKQGFNYGSAISAESVGGKALCMHRVTIPPGVTGNAHLHENHESAIFVVSGEGGMWFGQELEQHLVLRAGDFLYIPPGTPHLAYNRSSVEPLMAVLARTDPNEQESVVLLPHLDAIHSQGNAP